MKKKGFTLIELLAVIVVLALIALIATPIVMNVIKNASAGAAERSADNYVKAVETLIATEKLDGTPLVDGEYTIGTDGKLTLGENSYEVEVSGTKPVGGTIKIENGQVVKADTTIDYTDHTVKFENGKAEATEKGAKKLLTLADCDLEEGTANQIGAKYTCDLGAGARNFYVLEAGTSSKPATLILEGNYDMQTLAWCASGNDNACAADNLEAKLDEIVGNVWTKLDRSQIGIPSAQQIMVADGKAEDAYLGYSTLTNDWLYSYPENNSWGSSSPNGYWTSTPDANSSEIVWTVNSNGGADVGEVYEAGGYGIRPVITLSI